MKGLIVEARTNVARVTQDQSKYSKLLTKLIVQGLVKLDETDVVVYSRQSDVQLVKKVLDTARKEYIQLMKTECGEDIKIKISLNEAGNKMLPDTRIGGVFLTAYGGRLTCDNTLEARLNLIFEEQKPT